MNEDTMTVTVMSTDLVTKIEYTDVTHLDHLGENYVTLQKGDTMIFIPHSEIQWIKAVIDE